MNKSKDKSNQHDDELLNNLDNINANNDQPGKLVNNSVSEKISARKALESSENSSYETAANSKMLKGLTDDIVKELTRKSRARLWIILGMSLYFVVITVVVFVIVFNLNFSDYLKSILLGGFFASLIGLMVIIFKYVFSQSKELYDFWIDIRKGINHENDNETKQR